MTPYLFKQYHIDTSLITLSLSLSFAQVHLIGWRRRWPPWSVKGATINYVIYGRLA